MEKGKKKKKKKSEEEKVVKAYLTDKGLEDRIY